MQTADRWGWITSFKFHGLINNFCTASSLLYSCSRNSEFDCKYQSKCYIILFLCLVANICLLFVFDFWCLCQQGWENGGAEWWSHTGEYDTLIGYYTSTVGKTHRSTVFHIKPRSPTCTEMSAECVVAPLVPAFMPAKLAINVYRCNCAVHPWRCSVHWLTHFIFNFWVSMQKWQEDLQGLPTGSVKAITPQQPCLLQSKSRKGGIKTLLQNLSFTNSSPARSGTGRKMPHGFPLKANPWRCSLSCVLGDGSALASETRKRVNSEKNIISTVKENVVVQK